MLFSKGRRKAYKNLAEKTESKFIKVMNTDKILIIIKWHPAELKRLNLSQPLELIHKCKNGSILRDVLITPQSQT